MDSAVNIASALMSPFSELAKSSPTTMPAMARSSSPFSFKSLGKAASPPSPSLMALIRRTTKALLCKDRAVKSRNERPVQLEATCPGSP